MDELKIVVYFSDGSNAHHDLPVEGILYNWYNLRRLYENLHDTMHIVAVEVNENLFSTFPTFRQLHDMKVNNVFHVLELKEYLSVMPYIKCVVFKNAPWSSLGVDNSIHVFIEYDYASDPSSILHDIDSLCRVGGEELDMNHHWCGKSFSKEDLVVKGFTYLRGEDF